jgi:hypothetical protein
MFSALSVIVSAMGISTSGSARVFSGPLGKPAAFPQALLAVALAFACPRRRVGRRVAVAAAGLI